MGKAAKYVSAACLSERWFTGQACEGKIPGAVQPAGPGGAWLFDEDQFWRWWSERGRAPWYPSIGRRERNTGRDAISPTDDSGSHLRKLLGMPPRDD